MRTASHLETEIVADDTIPAIRITCEFNAPVENVFRVHTDAELSSTDSRPVTP